MISSANGSDQTCSVFAEVAVLVAASEVLLRMTTLNCVEVTVERMEGQEDH